MSVVSNNILAGASGQGGAGYEIERSLRFNSGDSAFLNRTPSAAGNRKTFTLSFWIKRAGLTSNNGHAILYAGTAGSTSNRTAFLIGNASFSGSGNSILFGQDTGGSWTTYRETSALFRDHSAWAHIVLAVDSTQATASDRIKIYVNGVLQESFATSNDPPQNQEFFINNTNAHYLGDDVGGFVGNLDAYLADVHFIDGQALAPTDFGETDDNGVWQPKKFGGTYTLPASGTIYSNNCNAVTNPANAFDGSLSTFARTSGPTSQIVLSNIGGLSGLVRVHVDSSGGTRYLISTNDGTTITTATFLPTGWITVGTASNITTITATRIEAGNTNPTSDCSIHAYEIDGTVLVDGLPAQGTNSFHLPFTDNSSNAALGTDTSGNSNTWTVNNLTAPGGTIDYTSMMTQGSDGGYVAGPERAFDGDLTTFVYTSASNNNGNITFTPSPSISHTTSVRAYWSRGSISATYSYNGGSSVSLTTNGWITLASGSGTFTSLNTYRGGDGNYFSAIEVDGTVLLTSTGANNDSLVDSPTNGTQSDTGAGGEVVGNYATMNPLAKASGLSLSDGNLDASGSAVQGCLLSTIFPSSGKYYAEYTLNTYQADTAVGVVSTDVDYNQDWVGEKAYTVGYLADGRLFQNGSPTNIGSYAAGDIIGVAFDVDTGKIWFSKNGTFINSGNPAAGTAELKTITGGKPLSIAFRGVGGAGTFNFGQRAFAYTAPSGYKSLNTANFDPPTIADGSKYFDTKLYTGNGGTQTVSGLEFSPSFVWFKNRASSVNHHLLDVVRGAGNGTNVLYSNLTNAEGATDSLTAFTSDGFTVGSNDSVNKNNNAIAAWAWDAGTLTNPVGDIWQGGATKYIGVKFASASGGTISYGQTSGSTTVEVWTSSNNSSWTQQGGTQTLSTGHTLTTSDQYVFIRNTSDATFTNWYAAATNGADGHYSSQTYPSGASWSGPSYTDHDWREDGGTLNKDGSIPSIVRANPSSGFSICAYTGTGANATFGHGLNGPVEMVIIKQRNGTGFWVVGHKDLPFTSDYYMSLNTADQVSTGAGGAAWQSTAPTSSVVSIGSSGVLNGSGNTHIAYCFAPVEGYSAMGSYTGNGSADGVFVYTGFKVAWLLIKRTDATKAWQLIDNARSTFNVTDDRLFPSDSGAESSGNHFDLDFLSNGFKCRTTHDSTNASSATYIYYAVAENPFKTARAR